MLQDSSDVLLPWFHRHQLPDPAAVTRETFLGAVWTHWKVDDLGRIGSARAMATASLLVELLRPACNRIEIGGELRQNAARVASLVIVAEAIPDLHVHAGTPHRLRRQLERGVNARWLRMTECADPNRRSLEVASVAYWPGSRRAKMEPLHNWIAVELHLVEPPAQFGLVQLLQTCSRTYGAWLARPLAQGGALPEGLAIEGGALWRTGSGEPVLVPTPTERSVFEAIDQSYRAPQDRHMLDPLSAP